MTVEDRLAALEATVVHLQDQLDVLRVVASYAPSIDGGMKGAGLFWAEDCVYDSDNDDPLRGRAAIEALAERIRGLEVGIGHNVSFPVAVVDGDRAIVTGESNTFVKVDDQYVVHRVSANRWELEKVDGRWLVTSRINRLLDGTDEARALLRRGAGSGVGQD
jgi:ketosteroid isomerase-like protein